MIPLTRSETEAVLMLTEHEVIKIAADKRCVSEHTEKNQIKAAMAKLGVTTQIGLMKEVFRRVYGVEYSFEEAKRILISLCLLVLFLGNINHVDQARRGRRVRRRVETEFVIEGEFETWQ